MKALFRLMAVAVLSRITMALIGPAHAADTVGVRITEIAVPARQAALEATIWYPAIADGDPVRIGDSKVFVGVAAQRDAPLVTGRFPLVLLSLGGLRSALHLGAWLAADLVAQGYMVVTTRPPQPGAGAPAEIWLRPADLSASLDAVMQDPVLAGHVAAERVAVIGMQRGGTAALALAGARLDPDAYRRSCDDGSADPDCTWFAQHGIDLHGADVAAIGAVHLDPRIKAVMAVDPEESRYLTATSLAAIKIPVAIVNLGAADKILPALEAGHLQPLIPGATYKALPGASRFSAFSTCTATGPAILRAAGEDDAICADAGAGSRDAIHAQLVMLIAAFLDQHLRR